jgi:hypothetical protein
MSAIAGAGPAFVLERGTDPVAVAFHLEGSGGTPPSQPIYVKWQMLSGDRRRTVISALLMTTGASTTEGIR